jgi:hypothetical protein
MSLPAIRRFVACWRRRRKGWCRFLNVATSGGEEMKVLAADVLAAGRASLNGTPLPAWIRQVGLQRAVDALWVLVELSGRCMSLEADSKKLDRVELSWSLYSRPCDWSRIELFGGDDRDMKLVWVESDVVKGTCFDLDAPTLLTLPEWLEGLTRRFEIAWEPPRMHPYELTESEQERVLAWLLRNRVSSIKPPES